MAMAKHITVSNAEEAGHATPIDPITEALAAWREASAAYNAACKADGAANFDTPDCRHWSQREHELSDALRAAIPSSAAGAASLLEFMVEDDGSDDPWVSVPRDTLERLIGWLRQQQ